MFNIKYNFLVLIQIFLNVINAILLIKVFGVSSQVDSYLLATSIMATIQLVQLVFFEQFIVFYTGLKKKSVEESNNFYNSTLFWTVVLGILSVGFLYLFRFIIFKIFAFNIDSQRLNYLNNISLILFLGAFFIPINALNERLLNAQSRYSIPYILSSLPNFFMVIVQIAILFLHKEQIVYLAYGQTFGWALASVIGTIFIAKKVIPFKFVFYHPEIKPLIKNSFTIKLSDNIYNITLPIILNNTLVLMPTGIVSCFYYAKKVIDTLKLLILGPSSKILKTNLTNCWVNKDIDNIKFNTKKFLKGSLILMIVAMVLTFLVLPATLKIISMGKLSSMDLKDINLIFISLCPWYLIVLLEAPYILTIYTAKKSLVPIFSNSLFILIFSVIIILLKNIFGVYVISIAATIAQISNYIIFKKYAKILMKEFNE